MDIREKDQVISITEYYYILMKHKWLILTCFTTIVALTLFFTFRMKPVYQATGTMVIENNYTVSPATGEKIDYGGYINQQLLFNTHLRMIKSRPVLEKVVRDLGLDQVRSDTVGETSELIPLKAFLAKIRRNLALLMGKDEASSLPPPDKLSRLIRELERRVTVREVRDTHLLKVSVEDHDPLRARDIANALTRGYIEFDASGRLRSSKEMLNWMTAQLYEIKKKLEDAEAEFQAYKQQEKLFSIEGKQNVITQKISDFNDAYLEARNQRLELDSKLAELKRLRRKRNIYNARLLIDNALIDTLYAQLLDAEVELNRLARVYKERHPKIEQIRSKISKTRNKLNGEIKKEIENLKAQRSVLINKENVLQETIANFENDAMETNKKELRYKILERNVDTNKKLYNTLLSKIEASNIDEKLDVSNIRIIEQAVPPRSPVRPNKMRNMMLGIVLGLMSGIGLAFLREYLDQSFRTEEDVQKYLGLPVLSVIPEADRP